MSEGMDTATDQAPIACMLDGDSYRQRMVWIADLNARALKAARRDDLRLTLDYAPSAIADIRRLIAQEQACCAFLSFDLKNRPDTLTLVVTAPEAARDAAETIFAMFQEKTPQPAPCGCAGNCGPAKAEAKPQGNRAVSAAAATASTAALACGVCCVLPLALPAVLLGSVGGILAWFADAHRYVTPVALLAVAAGWLRVLQQSRQTGKRPATSTLHIMGFATVMMALASLWPKFEAPIAGFLRH
ncbi:hypothetical protein [Gluconacetobacter asukensis]|uniref:hypothetical protein n=1 Tax=Gluconacetobacter asukensis TaxID=1017181 RepID=UPI001C7E3230|nr:hypothetical protein [Gluconacetobacter asukensis]